MRSKFINVTIDLNRIRSAAQNVRRTTGVPLIAVIKADAYGLGAGPVADALTGVADDFAYFSLEEAVEVRRPGIVLGPPEGDPGDYRVLHLRPSISTLEDARRFAGVPAAINIDTGMQRFGCPAEILDDVIAACGATEAFSHGADPAIGPRLVERARGRFRTLHVACTGMLDHPECWLDAVRPGLAIYRGSVRVTTKLTHVRELYGPAGYTGLTASRIGLFPAGYCEGVQPGPVVVNGRRQRIIEVNMNASYVTIDATDHVGDEVVMLGDGLNEAELADHFNVREHEILCRFTSLGMRHYVGESDGRVVKRRQTSAAELTGGATPNPATCNTQSPATSPRRT